MYVLYKVTAYNLTPTTPLNVREGGAGTCLYIVHMYITQTHTYTYVCRR